MERARAWKSEAKYKAGGVGREGPRPTYIDCGSTQSEVIIHLRRPNEVLMKAPAAGTAIRSLSLSLPLSHSPSAGLRSAGSDSQIRPFSAKCIYTCSGSTRDRERAICAGTLPRTNGF